MYRNLSIIACIDSKLSLMIEGLILGQLQGNYELFIYPQLLRQATRERMAYGIFSYLTILTWQIKENLLAPHDAMAELFPIPLVGEELGSSVGRGQDETRCYFFRSFRNRKAKQAV